MSLKFCIIIESNSQKSFFAIVLYTNMAAVTSGTNQEYVYCFIAKKKKKITSFELDSHGTEACSEPSRFLPAFDDEL